MNKEALYREIGHIDDDLIQAASEARREQPKKPMVYHAVAIAACFCLIFGGILFGLQRDTIYINEISAPSVGKVIVPAGEDTEIVPMTYDELLAYYGVVQLPDAIGEDLKNGEALKKQEQSFFVLYQDLDDNILYDTNILYYSNPGSGKTLSIAFAKAEEPSRISYEDARRSRIDGVSVLLAASVINTDYTAYWADFELNGVSVRIISDGLNEDEFVNAVTEFIGVLK